MHNLPTLYNPAEKQKETLIREFVVRTKTFEDIFKDLKTSKMKHPEQHYLIVGQRGAGKTTLLHRLMYAINDDEKLEFITPIMFNEEQYHISELTNLWESIALYLQENIEGFDGLLENLEKHYDKKDYEDIVFNGVVKALKAKNRKVVLLIDNFISLISKFSEIEVKKLREVLMTCAEIRLIAASPILPDDVIDYKKPLMGFFKTVILQSLTSKEITILLQQLAKIYKQEETIDRIVNQFPGRIEALRRLTGGVIRTIALLFGVFVDNEDGKSLKDLQLTLDAVTPLYKHRMDDLPKFQQKIVDVVAKNWDAISTKEIAQKTRIESKAVSAQMKQLEKNQIIEKEPTSTKNHLYRIKERFFNIWYLMRYGRKEDRQRVIWLVKFLEAWCDDSELSGRVQKHLENLIKGSFDHGYAVLMGQAFLSSEKISNELKYEVVNTTQLLIPNEISKGLNLLDQELVSLGLEFYKKNDYVKTIDAFSKIKNKDLDIYSKLAFVTRQAKEFNKSISYLQKAIEITNDDKIKSQLFHDIGITYDLKIKDEVNAEHYYKLSADLGNSKAMSNYAGILIDRNQHKEAESLLLDLISKGYERGRFELARMLIKLERNEEAIIELNKAYQILQDPQILERIGDVYFNKDNFEKAELTYKKALEKGYDLVLIKLAYFHLLNDLNFEKALNYLNQADSKGLLGVSLARAVYYSLIDDLKNAEKCYLKSFYEEKDERALKLIAVFYRDKGEYNKAEEYFDLARKYGDDVDMLQASMYFNSRNNTKKEIAIKYSKAAYKNDGANLKSALIYALTLLWNSKIDLAIEIFKPNLENQEWIEENLDFVTTFFILLMANEQYHTCLEMFNSRTINLKDLIKPVYFALMQFMKAEYPNEHLKMGEELRETVDEIIKKVESYKVDM